MAYNFDELVDRVDTYSIKWESSTPNLLPMWIADMDFKAAPEITQTLKERVEHGVFGYTLTPPAFYGAITNWWKKRHNLSMKEEWLIALSGVIPALAATIKALASKGDKIVVQPPVYNHFFTTIANSDCDLVENKLLYEHGQYRIDFDDLEEKTDDPDVKFLLLSNPHNPVGRAWTAEELNRLGEICLKNNVIVLSDEIHSDLVYDPFRHKPFASLGQAHSTNSITFCSPSKTFNLAGLQVGYLFTENKLLRKKIAETLEKQDMVLLNTFAISGLIAAYDQGTPWLEALKTYLYDNFKYLVAFCGRNLPNIGVVPLQATYLVWLDCGALRIPASELSDKLLGEEGLKISPGHIFGKEGTSFIRVNIACPRALLADGLERLARMARKVR